MSSGFFRITTGTKPWSSSFTKEILLIKSSNTSRLRSRLCKLQPPPCVPPPLLTPCLSILRGVNSRGVGVGGSTMLHGYRMCHGGSAAWLPSVRMSHSALLSHFPPSASLGTSSDLLPSFLILYLAFFVLFSLLLIFRIHGNCDQCERFISSLKREKDVQVCQTDMALTLESDTCKPFTQKVSKRLGFIISLKSHDSRWMQILNVRLQSKKCNDVLFHCFPPTVSNS